MAYHPHCLAKNDRNQAMIADYFAGLSRAQLAAKYGVSLNRVGKLLWRHKVTLPAEERKRRTSCQTPPKSPGRPAVWPDCPPELEHDYKTLRRYGFPAVEARRKLEKAAA